ncbi:hypothetical protein HQ590_03020, partial [bacterium]|nr:hypothetical protein [bacterium]
MSGQSAQPTPGMQAGAVAALGGYLRGMYSDQGTAPELDVTARTVVLSMQPHLREELLQGMQEQGPEAYRKFIQNY